MNKLENIDFSPEFSKAFEILNNSSDNLFITGKAGTGKSTFLEYFRQNTKKRVAVVAPTGVAALNVRGQTIHSFFKFRPQFFDKTSIKVKKDRKVYAKLDMIIIDEISMVRADLFAAIEHFLRLNGPKQGQPFGGVQICVIGDLFQLPPIISYNEREVYYSHYHTPFFFGCEAFDMANFHLLEFEKIHRQSEKDFIEVLNKIRIGDVSQETLTFINKRHSYIPQESGNKSQVILTTTNQIAEQINQEKLTAIKSEEFKFTAKMSKNFAVNENRLPAPKELRLKIGAQVMFTKNDQKRRWVNGTIGTVTYLSKDDITVTVSKEERSYNYNVPKEQWETIKYNFDAIENKIKEEIVGEFIQYPLMPAWAVTIHKSQGKTLDHVVIDLGAGAFASGQLYVALSRCRTFDNIILKKPVQANDIKCNNNVIEFTREYKASNYC
jgi:ATP-dependent DNA helicase PIF1